ncbi:protein shisa-4-like isoform X2 [Pseudophryne corroboree]|uniref:protein shisa-4-like isoform X2 n=1 Tax=Pseudophryne corroboree TaxID=495146 RepID=UPI0030817CD1
MTLVEGIFATTPCHIFQAPQNRGEALHYSSVLADDCSAYVGSDYQLHQPQTCILSFCSGTCTNRYCSIIPGLALDQSQFMCILNNLYFVVGAGIVIFLLLVVGIIACCCKSLCLCCQLCSSPPPSSRTMLVTNVIPPQALRQIPYSSVPTEYQPLPSQNAPFGQPDKAYLPPPYPGADNLAFAE